MYKEIEVFEEIQKFVGNRKEDVDKAYDVHRQLLKYIPEEVKEECFFRYLELGGTIGLNVGNYKIYEYPHEKTEAFRLIYPKDRLDNFKEVGLEAKVNFEFISTEAVLLEVPVDDFEKFEEAQWTSFKEAIVLAANGKKRDRNVRNIEIKW